MEARKLEAEHAPHGQPWLDYVERYRQEGLVNEELFANLRLLDALHAEACRKPGYAFVKQTIERSLAVLLLIMLLPLFLVIACAIKLSSRGTVFYTQNRAGRFLQPFKILKFRTMRTDVGRQIFFGANDMHGGMFKRRDDPRLTRIGRVLRRWSLDELPQLVNIARGDMVLVGPRPLTLEDSSTIPPEHLLRFAVLPGITGLWQVKARASMDARLKIRLDYEYVLQRSLALDASLLLKTVPNVVKGIGAW